MATQKKPRLARGMPVVLRNRVYAVVKSTPRGPVLLFDGAVFSGDGTPGVSRLAVFDTRKAANESAARLAASHDTPLRVVRLNDLSGVVL